MTNQRVDPAQPQPLSRTTRAGVLPGVVHLAIDVADRGQATAIGVLQDARVELRATLESSVEWAEKVAGAALRLVRRGIQRADEASAEVLTSAGTILSSATQSAREATRAAAELATTTAAGVAGPAAA